MPEADQKELADLAASSSKSPFKLSAKDHKEEKAFYSLLEEKLTTRHSERSARQTYFQGRVRLRRKESRSFDRFRFLRVTYPNLLQYLAYLKDAKKIYPREILKEQKLLEDTLYSALAKTGDEQNLVRSSRNVKDLHKLFALTITPEEYEAYKLDKKFYDIRWITGFLNKKIMDLDTYYERALFLETGYEPFIQQCEAFYDLTLSRDRAFVENMLQEMDRGSWIVEKIHNPRIASRF